MTRRLIVTPEAQRDVRIVAMAFGRGLAGRSARAVRSTFRRLLEWPELGEPQDYADPELAGVRCATVDGFRSHLIFYQTGEAVVTILHVVHGARDLDALFGPRDGEGHDQP